MIWMRDPSFAFDRASECVIRSGSECFHLTDSDETAADLGEDAIVKCSVKRFESPFWRVESADRSWSRICRRARPSRRVKTPA
jgi:hypothetical protein